MASKRVSVSKHNSDDRISGLPDAVIYHILSFVPTVFVVRMSVLSRRWRRVWHSIPNLLFRDSVGFKRKETFYLFVQKCLSYRREAMRFVADSAVTSFKLSIDCDSGEDLRWLSKWLHSNAVMNNVKELDLYFEEREKRYSLPSAVLNGSCLAHLKLDTHVKISKSCSVSLPSLKSLFLMNISIDGEVLCDLVLGCLSLEKCVLANMTYKGGFRVSSLSLKYLDAEFRYEIETNKSIAETESGKIEAINLQTLVLRSACMFPYDFSAFTGIKDLFLENLWAIKPENLKDQIPKLVSLENLTLELIYEHDEEEMSITITNWNLKRLILHKYADNDLKLTLTTPGLVCFKYKGGAKLSLPMSKLNHHVKGQFCIDNRSIELMSFLKNINCQWKSVDLHVFDDRELMVPKGLRIGNPPWPDLKHLKVSTRKASASKSELRKSLQWLCPFLETLSIEDGSKCPFLDNYGYGRWLPTYDD